MTTAPAGDRLGAAPSQSGNTKPRALTRPLWLKAAVLVVACIATLYLGRQVISIAVAKDQAADHPGRALQFRPHDSAALEGVGERVLASAATSADTARVRDLAGRALDRSPLEVGAVRLLALAAERAGQDDRALRLMTIAGDRSVRDGPSHAWLFDYWFKRHDWARAFRHADLLLRTHPQVAKQIDPYLVSAVVSDPAARLQITKRFADAPFWRGAFLSDLAQSNTDPAPLLAILTDLDRAHAKLSDIELEEVLVSLVNRHLYDEAYLTWTQSLPPSALMGLGYVYDPAFTGLPGAAPFNWALHQPNGGAVEMTASPAGGHRRALAVHLYDAPTAPLAAQLITLPPGRYVLHGRNRSDAGGRSGLAWTVRCDGGPVIARLSPTGGAGQWTDGSTRFDTPQSGCAAQWLELVADPGASFQGGGVWWSGLAIDRAAS
ncbi:MAG TPA: hypothetical protein VG407_16815 [Caulobacteraceae bacterium]|jgi:hypothetical protein|nr:hypothetical protein [Caulobacteraceae bacterium]